MSGARRPAVLVASVLALGGCDALIGLGEQPSGASATSSSTGDATSSTGGPASTSSTGSSGGDGGAGGDGGTSTTGDATASSSGAGGAGGTGPSGTPCGPGDDGLCAKRDGERCLLRRQTIPDTEGVGVTPETIIDRFGRGLVVTDDLVAFVRRTAGVGKLTLALRSGSAQPLDAKGDLGGPVAGIALSGDGEAIAIVPHSGNPPIQKVEVEAVEEGQVPLVETIDFNGDPMTAVVAVDEARGFFAAIDASGQLAFFDLDAPEPCFLDATGGESDVVELERLGGSGDSLSVVSLFLAGAGAEVVTGPASCAGHASPTTGVPMLALHATARFGGEPYVLGIDQDGTPVVRDDDGNRHEAFPSLALDAHAQGVIFGGLGGGLLRCNEDLAGCVTLATRAEVGEVGHVRATPFGAITVGWESNDDAIVTCIDARE